MKKYEVLFSGRARKTLKKMDQHESLVLLSWIKKNLVGTSNPRAFGKSLTGNYSGYWRYRIGSYRIIAEIDDDVLKIDLIGIGHRKDMYK